MFMDDSGFGNDVDDPTRSTPASATLVDGLAAASLDGPATYTDATSRAQARPGSASLPVRPVSARTWGNSGSSAGPGGRGLGPSGTTAGGPGMATFNNDLFGDELEELEENTRAAAVQQPQLAAQQRLQQQRLMQQQKRKERTMMSGMVVSNTERPGSAAGARPGSAYGARPLTPAMATAMGRPYQPDAPSYGGGGASAQGGLRQQYGHVPAAAAQARAAGPSDQGAHRPGAAETELERGLAAQGMSTVYDPERDVRAPSSTPKPAPTAHTASTVDASDMRTFLMQPGPKPGQGAIQCHIKRDKGKAGLFPTYSLWLEGHDGPGSTTNERFLLGARKRKKSKSSNYLISLDEEDLTRQSGNYFGKLRSNFVGTEFVIYDKGVKPKEAEANAGVSQLAARAELGAVMYQYNVLGTRGPRKMTALIPQVSPDGVRALFRPEKEEQSMLYKFRESGDTERAVVMRNKPPKWNDSMQAYCLNFNGRVTQPSVKNFQLIADDNKEHVILQFGKVGKDVFTMDFAWPINALQAFAICLTSFDNKLACE